MRKQTMYDVTRQEAELEMDWAAKIIEVEDGYIGFESVDEYETHMKQI